MATKSRDQMLRIGTGTPSAVQSLNLFWLVLSRLKATSVVSRKSLGTC